MAAGFIGLDKDEKKNSVAPGTPPVVQRKPSIRVVAKAASEHGGKHKVMVSVGPGDELDITGALTASLAHALWQLRGGVDVGNWVDGETLLNQLLIPTDAVAPSSHVASEVVIPGKRTVARR